MEMYRQGDVVLVKLPDGYVIDPDQRRWDANRGTFGPVAKSRLKNGRLILVEGETTGHAHGIPNAVKAGITMSHADALAIPGMTDLPGWARGGNGRMDIVRLPKPATLTHEEHGTIELGAGDYAVVRQREYAGPNATRRVFD